MPKLIAKRRKLKEKINKFKFRKVICILCGNQTKVGVHPVIDKSKMSTYLSFE